ncbi:MULTISPECIES: hypothetical protein, partial [unclassified Polaromonas]|uniref:hypothetical protein n=1 Tax=unclassified Polaromonas TaxID=2638319 RepID=UPI001E301977
SIVSNSVPAQPIVFLQIFLEGNFAGVVYNEMRLTWSQGQRGAQPGAQRVHVAEVTLQLRDAVLHVPAFLSVYLQSVTFELSIVTK